MMHALILLPLLAIYGMSMAGGVVYKVGDSAGWTLAANVDYSKWASDKVFRAGDTLLFQYDPQAHNVLQVSRSDFHTCETGSPIASYSSGNDSITIAGPGHYFYLCGFPEHCKGGQKVDIRVLKSADAPSKPSQDGYVLAPAASPKGPIAPGPGSNRASPCTSFLLSNWFVSCKLVGPVLLIGVLSFWSLFS